MTFQTLLERHHLWLIGVIALVSAGAFGYQVLGKAKVVHAAAAIERDDAENTVVATNLVQPIQYVDVDAQDVRIEIGMSTTEVNAALSAIAIDLAPVLATRYPGGESPASGEFWELCDFNLVIRLYSKHAIITSVGYWSELGFGSEVERRARSMVLNTGKRSVLIDPELRDNGGVSTY